jgi:two-component system NtrC family sensor kinase
LHVQDFGKGIPHEVGPRIFEPFFTTKAADKGTGLGLHICRQVVEQMGGDVSFRSAPDGTTFVVRLPIANSDF